MDCCSNSGSRVYLTFNGQRWDLRGAVTIRPGGVESDAQANADGSMYVTNKAVLWEADITLSDRCGIRLADILRCSVDATFDLIDLDRTYFFTAARVVGRPTINTESGEISGLRVATATARQG